MKKFAKRGAALLLAAALVISNTSVFAEETVQTAAEEGQAETIAEVVTEEPVTEALATEAPTEPVTEAPVTEAPTEPVTEVPVTEAPTELVTEVPVTEAPTELVTEAPTEPVTEAPAKEAPTESETQKQTETQQPAETETEAETEAPGEYVWKQDAVSVRVKMPESIALPENAVLKAGLVKTDNERYKEDLRLVKKAAEGLYFGDYLIYDIHFETPDGSKISLKSFENEDGKLPGEIEAKLEFANPVFAGQDFSVNQVKLYHIRDLTERELAAARKAASEEGTGDADTQKAEEIKAKISYADTGNGITAIEFKTSSFSDFVLAVTTQEHEEESETESEMQSETESETESETSSEGEAESETSSEGETESEMQSESETESEMESEMSSESETETEPESETEMEIKPVIKKKTKNKVPSGTELHTLEITVRQNGAVSSKDAQHYVITVSGKNKNSVKNAKAEGGNVKAEVENGVLMLQMSVTGGGESKVKISNLAADTYTIDGGGNYFIEGKDGLSLSLDKAYVSVYQTNGANKDGTQYGEEITTCRPTQVVIADDPKQEEQNDDENAESGGEQKKTETKPNLLYNQNVVITNVYTTAKLEVTAKEAGRPLDGGLYRLSFTQGSKKWSGDYSLKNGKIELKGLPFGVEIGAGEYKWSELAVPAGYVAPIRNIKGFKLAQPTQGNENAHAAKTALEISPTKLQVLAKDMTAQDSESYANLKAASVEMTVAEKENPQNIWNCKNADILTGQLETEKTYVVTQTTRQRGYVITQAAKEIKIKNSGEIQTVFTENKPTVVSAGAVLVTNLADGLTGGESASVGAQLEIRDANGNVVNDKNGNPLRWTAEAAHKVFTGDLDPGSYTLVETKPAAGRYAKTAEVSFTVGSDDSGRMQSAVVKNITTKVRIYRRGFDSSPTDINGKDVRYMLAGAQLQILDANGNVVDEWTTTDQPYICEGKLSVGENYTLVETFTPEGYEPGNRGSFSTKVGDYARDASGNPVKNARGEYMMISIDDDGKITPSVTMQTGKYRGRIRVAKRAAYRGTAVKVNQTFYCALFTDAAKTKRYEKAGVKALRMTTSDIYTTVQFEGLPAGTYYVGETDARGNLISGSETSQKFTIAYTVGETIKLGAGGAAIAEIENNFTSAPSGGYEKITDDELQQSYEQEYADFGGSAEAAAQIAAGDNGTNPVQTGDTTNIFPYLIALAAALLIIIGVLVYKKKK